jgi:23S rRNA (adenine2503-C2)-methyltransferase
MNILQITGNRELARVFVAELDDGSKIEFVESVQPPKPLAEKWVLIVSTLKGCPVKCPICDAGGRYEGKLSKKEILDQISYLIFDRFSDGRPLTKRLKIQFARMGDPAFNDAVLDVLEELPHRFSGVPIQPSISTVAPFGRDAFFSRLLEIKNRLYPDGWFQMQFSIHTTDETKRRELIPIRTWTLHEMADFGRRFVLPGDLKISLNFAPVEGYPISPDRIAEVFSKDTFLIKLTPVNPTHAASASGLRGIIDAGRARQCEPITEQFRARGFETILSVGDEEENQIGSNCGMYVQALSSVS